MKQLTAMGTILILGNESDLPASILQAEELYFPLYANSAFMASELFETHHERITAIVMNARMAKAGSDLKAEEALFNIFRNFHGPIYIIP